MNRGWVIAAALAVHACGATTEATWTTLGGDVPSWEFSDGMHVLRCEDEKFVAGFEDGDSINCTWVCALWEGSPRRVSVAFPMEMLPLEPTDDTPAVGDAVFTGETAIRTEECLQ